MKGEEKPNWFWLLLPILWIWILFALPALFSNTTIIPYSEFLVDLQQNKIAEVSVGQQQILGKFKEQGKTRVQDFVTNRVDEPLSDKLAASGVKFYGVQQENFWPLVLSWIIPVVILIAFLNIMARAREGEGGMGMGTMTIGKSKARVYIEKEIQVSFADVAGVDEAKEELKEVVAFLREPERYSRLGARMPKGILLVGPPGTGKTLLARAVAGEAKVPFFSISGSEFVELFVGVGAARVRDLFQQAQKKAPCIIFIDELDALGRARGISPLTGSHDEKEQTLNQLLAELDGFDPMQGVVLLAATNRPEILDPALLRAGRFDRHVLVDRPDKTGRIAIVKVHLRAIKCDEHCDSEQIAAMTPGFTGADLANLVNEAALLAARREAKLVSMGDFSAAIERIVAGLEKKNRLLNEKERRIVAHHEMGHALVALAIPGSDPVQKISIIPRGVAALGYTLQRPLEDRFLMSRQELEGKLAVLMGGRAAEQLVFGEISTGAADDLVKATAIARSMVARYGLDENLGPVTYDREQSMFLDHGEVSANNCNASEETSREIECAVRSLIVAALHKATGILSLNRELLLNAAQELLAKETLTPEEIPAPVAPPELYVPSLSERSTRPMLG